MRKFDELKIGDKVVVYDKYSTNIQPRECLVTKIGRKYIHVASCKYDTSKFTIDTGYGEYGQTLFPGSISEFREHVSLNDYRKEIKDKLGIVINSLSKNDLDNIMLILNKV